MNEVPVRLLRDTLQARGPVDPSPDCLDAETVAAWADDALGRDERRAVEAHAADCGRCQALVVAVVRTSPPPVPRSWWRMPMMGWVVPLTAAAAALLVWMSVPGTPREPSNALASRLIEQGPPGPSRGAGPSRRLDTSLPSSAAPNPPGPKPAKVDARGGTAKGETKTASGKAETLARQPIAAPPAPRMSAFSGTSAGPPSPSPAPPETAAAAAVQQPAIAGGIADAPPVGAPRTAAARIGLANPPVPALEARRLAVTIVSPDANSRWRILTNGSVEHSTDGGATWEGQLTGVAAMLAAGASPAPSICWLVGPQGIVLLTADGRSWRRVAFPETADLTSIRATDDKSATVVTSDGRAFSTTDGGQSWTR